MKPDPCANPALPIVILTMAPDFHQNLGKTIPLTQGMEIAVASNGSKFMAVVTDTRAELIDDQLTIFCCLQRL